MIAQVALDVGADLEKIKAAKVGNVTVETAIAPARVAYEQMVLSCGIYPREIAHRRTKRGSYRTA